MVIVSESIWNKENCFNILVIVYTFWGIEISFVCLFVYLLAGCVPLHTCWRQRAARSSPLLSCGPGESNLSHQTWWQTPSPNEMLVAPGNYVLTYTALFSKKKK